MNFSRASVSSELPMYTVGDIELKFPKEGDDPLAFDGITFFATLDSKVGFYRTRQPIARHPKRQKIEDYVTLYNGTTDGGAEPISQIIPSLELWDRYRRYSANKKQNKGLLKRGELHQVLKYTLIQPYYEKFIQEGFGNGVPFCNIYTYLEKYWEDYGESSLLTWDDLVYLKSFDILTVEQLADIEVRHHKSLETNPNAILLDNLDNIVKAANDYIVQIQSVEKETAAKMSRPPKKEDYPGNEELYHAKLQIWQLKNPNSKVLDIPSPSNIKINNEVDRLASQQPQPASPLRQQSPNNGANAETATRQQQAPTDKELLAEMNNKK